jgi:anaerobic ribonucleoside-triphosphate reductase activating protein
MLLHAFVPSSRANGPGSRAVIYFQGCSLNCKGCWNPSTHKFRGKDVSIASVVRRVEEARNAAALDGVTFSGGEPMQQATALAELMGHIRKTAPTASFGMFTGYTIGELATGHYVTWPPTSAEKRIELWRGIRALLDFAVMGRYEHTELAAEPLRTSRNQKLMLFGSRYHECDFEQQLVEISIEPNGNSVVTGFPVLGFPI